MHDVAPAGTKRLFSFYLTTCLHRRLKVAAALEETGMSDLLERILESRLPRLSGSPRPQHQNPAKGVL